MVEVKTEESLLNALKRATEKTPSAEEIHNQRVSFIMGTVKEHSDVTRDKVEEILARQEGRNTKP